MRMIILHGPPASGKLTIARALEKQLDYRVLHNHLSVDLALEVYPGFGDGDFFEFVDEIRSQCIEKACVNQMSGLIITLCYDTHLDQDVVDRWVKIVESYGGTVVPIYLAASLNTLTERVSNKSRSGTKKIQTIAALNQAMSQYSFGPIEEPASFQVDTEDKSAKEAANEIMRVLF